MASFVMVQPCYGVSESVFSGRSWLWHPYVLVQLCYSVGESMFSGRSWLWHP